MGYLITSILILIEMALFIFSIGDIGISIEAKLFPQYKEYIAVSIAIINLLIVCLMLIVSVSSMMKIKNKQKIMGRQFLYVIGLSIIWIANLAVNAVCTNYADGDSSTLIGAGVMIFVGLIVILPTFIISHNKASKIKQEEFSFRKQTGEDILASLMEKAYFKYEKAEWYYDEAFKEYCFIHGLSSAEDLEQHMPRLIGIGDLREEEQDKLWDYAGLQMGYLLTWLASRDLLSFELKETLNYPLEEEELKAHTSNGLELLRTMDFKISSSDIGAGEPREAFEYKPGYRRTFEMDKKDGFIHKFLGHYINGMTPFNSNFYKDISNIITKNNVQYCQEFSWDTYEKIAALLNQKYDYFVYCEKQFQIEERLEYPEQESDTSNMIVYTIENDRWWLDFQVYKRPDVKEGYRDKVIQSIKDMSLSLQREIGRKILEAYYDDYAKDFISAMPANKKIKRTADHKTVPDNMELIGEAMNKISNNPEELFMYDELFGCLELHIYAPRNENIIAYVISGDSLLEEEHGISVSIFDNQVLEVGYGYDFENPWIANRDYINDKIDEPR